jgi:hypothetical protein
MSKPRGLQPGSKNKFNQQRLREERILHLVKLAKLEYLKLRRKKSLDLS